MTSADQDDILTVNPYESHPSLSRTEAEVLWEYAKLAHNVKTLVAKTRQLNEQPDVSLLGQLRVLERKMGLVLTLYKASAWGVINEQSVADASLSFDDSTETTVRT